MIKFDKSYYDEEIRCDYKVNPLKKRNWAALLEVIAEVDRVCRKYNIQYFADWGTLLGAIRHKGFVPWDDDVDLAMKREDYLKFQEILPIEFQNFENGLEEREEGEKMFYFSPLKAKKNYASQTIISSCNAICFEEDYLKRFHGYPFVASVDIFPIDYFPADNEETNLVYKIIEIIANIAFIEENWNSEGKPANDKVLGYLSQVEIMTGQPFDYSKNVRKNAIVLLDNLCAMYSKEESEYLTYATWYAAHQEKGQRYRKEWYDEAIYVPFENIEIAVPKEYHQVLTAMYKDYMTPVYYGDHGADQARMLEEQFDFKGQDPMTVVMEHIKNYE